MRSSNSLRSEHDHFQNTNNIFNSNLASESSHKKMHSGKNKGRPGKTNIYVVIGFGILITLACIVWLNKDLLFAPSLSPAAAQSLIERAAIANAFLENEHEDSGKDEDGNRYFGYEEAEKIYVELANEVPDQLLPIQNLAVTRLGYFKYMKGQKGFPVEEMDAQRELAEQSIEDLIAKTPKSPVPLLMKADLMMTVAKELTPEIADVYRQAVTIAPDNAVACYALYEAFEHSALSDEIERESLRDEMTESIYKAWKLEPENVRVVTSALVALATKQDERFTEVLKKSKPLLEHIAKAREVDLMGRAGDQEMIVSKIKFAEDNFEDDLQSAIGALQQVQNLTRPLEIVKSDLSRIKPGSSLEYMIHSFDEKVISAAAKLESPETKIDPVSFSPQTAINEIDSALAIKVCDGDLDGKMDIVVVTESKLSFYSQTDDKWNEQFSQPLDGKFSGIVGADLDRDINQLFVPDSFPEYQKQFGPQTKEKALLGEVADTDFVVFGDSGIRIFENYWERKNQAPRTFRLIEQDAEINEIKEVTALTLCDFDFDNDLDIIAVASGAIKVLQNRGNQKFVDMSANSFLPEEKIESISLFPVDWDRDADIDILVARKDHVGILENLRHGQLRYRKLNDHFKALTCASDVAATELDGIASWDLFAVGKNGTQSCKTLLTDSDGSTREIQTPLSEQQNRLKIGDFNNDSFVDAVTWAGKKLTVVTADPNSKQLSGESNWSEELNTEIQDVSVVDLDRDGKLDLVVATENKVEIFGNDSKNDNHWISFHLVGIYENISRSNHHGVGCMFELKAGRRYQAKLADGAGLHFGLGKSTKADVARIVWTNGMPQTIINPESNQIIRELMFEKGSCPFIYTWNGEEFEFLTDCLWAAPIGLRINEQVEAPTRAWEYIKIPGERLQPKDGYYEIKLTEELWEAAYFDQVDLIAIDHPADVEIYSNEKVGPPFISQYKVHTVKEPRLPVSAKDDRGNDLLEKLSKRDDDFAQPFGERLQKGLVPMHHVELDLGDLKAMAAPNKPENITLFMTGWIRPTDSSLNIGFSQNPEVDGAIPPVVLVPDAKGNWQKVPTPMGFPGGKTKTIAIDLSQAFLTDDFRLRIQTSAEIYWDEAFFTVNEPQSEIRRQDLPPVFADVQYRGFSKRFYNSNTTPELYDYQDLSTQPRWPPMRGNFTRYGDVLELITESDDRMVVIGAGDEISIRFPLPKEELSAGWKRDFFLHSVGYDKDADLNTLFGQSVEPMPFLKMKSYPYEPRESFPDSPLHRQYFEEYQTRKQSRRKFWSFVEDYKKP